MSNAYINGFQTQRSRVTSVGILFDSNVSLPANSASAFRLTRQIDQATVELSANAYPSSDTLVILSFTGTLTEFGSLKDGRYTLTILGNLVSNVGGFLDGNGDGIGEDDNVLASASAPAAPTNIFRLFGVSDGDGAEMSPDFAVFRTFFGLGASIFDNNYDGQTNADDFTDFRKRFGLTLPYGEYKLNRRERNERGGNQELSSLRTLRQNVLSYDDNCP